MARTVKHETKKKPSVAAPRPERWILIALAIAIVAIYAQSVSFDFINLDDNLYTYENFHVQRGITGDGISWALTTNSIYWQPVTFLSHMLVYELFGAAPGWHHLVNVLLHIVNTLLLFFLLRRTTGALWRSAIVAAIFALHPLRVESVTWIAERKDVLCALFWLLATRAYARYAETPSIARYSLVAMWFALALMSKPLAVTLPIFLLLLDWWPLARNVRPSRLVLEKLPLLVMSVISSAITIVGQREAGALDMLGDIPFLIRLMNAVVSYATYLGAMIWPFCLAVMYPYSREIPIWHTLAAAALIVSISSYALAKSRSHRYLIVGWLSFLVVLVPNIGLLQAGPQARADRFTYLASIGISIAVVWGAAELLGRWNASRRLIAAAAIVPIASWAVVSAAQTRYWRDSQTLFEHALSVTQNNRIAHNNLGEILKQRGRIDEAENHFREALRIDPNYADCLNNVGSIYLDRGKFDDALALLTRAVTLKPKLAHAHFNRGRALRELGRDTEAIEEYSESLRLALPPIYSSVVYQEFGRISATRGEDALALSHFQHALALNPGLVRARKYLAMTLANLGRDQQALREFAEYLKSEPNDAEALKAVVMLRGKR
jgi:protein O-mannosyl-transferase